MNTSGRRKKQISEEDMNAIISVIHDQNSSYSGILSTWLYLGSVTGLRPHEWCQAEIIDRLEGCPADAGPFLRVRNSKNSNGRAHGDYRHLDLTLCSNEVIDLLGGFTAWMRQVYDEGGYRAMYENCKKLLQIANRKLFGEAGQWIQIYSPRHKFSSEAKLLLSLGDVAAAMGHATDKTATLHYGNHASGSGSLAIRPVAGEVAKVRKRPARPSTRKTPKAPTPG